MGRAGSTCSVGLLSVAEDTGALSTAWLVASVETSWEGATELGQALHFLLGVDKALPQEFAPRGVGSHMHRCPQRPVVQTATREGLVEQVALQQRPKHE